MSPEDPWVRLDHRLVILRIGQVTAEFTRLKDQKKREVLRECRERGNDAGLAPGLARVQLEMLQARARRLYEIYREVWRTQGYDETPEFLRSVLTKGIVPAIDASRASIQDDLTLFAQRTGYMSNITAVLDELARSVGRLKGDWARDVEIAATELQHHANWAPVRDARMPELELEQRKILSRITGRLLNLQAGTPLTHLRKSLASRRVLLDDMVTAKFLRVVRGQYLPTFRGIELLDDDIRRIVRGNLNCVLNALQRLYRRRSDEVTFSFEAIVRESESIDPTRDDKDVLPALLLGEEFGYYYFPDGVAERNDHMSVGSATVAEKILDFVSVEAGWASILAQEEADRLRKVKTLTEPVPSRVAPNAAHGSTCSFEFMQNPNLKRIVERDYDELQRVRPVSAVKSRYVLCGGLIEGLLLDALLGDEAQAKAAKKAPRSKGGSHAKSLVDWNLAELIDVALELQIIGMDVEKLSHVVRDYRNLIHPGNEMQSTQKVAAQEADIAEKVVEIVIRELGQKFHARTQ